MLMIKAKKLTKKDDLNLLVNLFNTLYPSRPIKRDYILWRYLDNPFEASTFIIKDRDKIIGSYSSCIFEGLIKGKKGKIGFLYDLMVDPDYQNRGLVLPLYNAVINSITKKNPDFLYAFVNGVSMPLYQKFFKWKPASKLNLYLAKVGQIKSSLLKKNLDFNIIYGTGLKKSINRLAVSAYKDTGIKTYVYRSYKFLSWRSRKIFGKDFKSYCFYKNYRLVGFCLIKLFKDHQNNKITADLIEIIAFPKEYIYTILYQVFDAVGKLGVEDIATSGFGQIEIGKLEKLGFKKTGLTWHLIVSNVKDGAGPGFYVNMLDAEMF